MDNELLTNTVADVNFLLMLTSFALFMGAAALVTVIGLWEIIKEERKKLECVTSYLYDVITKHNYLSEHHDILVKAYIDSSERTEVSLAKHTARLAELDIRFAGYKTDINKQFSELKTINHNKEYLFDHGVAGALL